MVGPSICMIIDMVGHRNFSNKKLMVGVVTSTAHPVTKKKAIRFLTNSKISREGAVEPKQDI